MASPWHLEIQPPAKPIIFGDETCRGVNIGDRFVNKMRNKLVCGAEYKVENSGKVIVLSGLTFMDAEDDDDDEAGTLIKNNQFALNLINYLSLSFVQ